ncbi:hypothetical protein FOA52_006473 [Chlamydomonas sp. UWO 241]|nr:hypothetical protein FOA52_006473 [Chlamydomonas sp. UWO 241]
MSGSGGPDVGMHTMSDDGSRSTRFASSPLCMAAPPSKQAADLAVRHNALQALARVGSTSTSIASSANSAFGRGKSQTWFLVSSSSHDDLNPETPPRPSAPSNSLGGSPFSQVLYVPSEWASVGDGLPPDQQLYLAQGRDGAERMAGARRVAAAAISAAAAKYTCGAAPDEAAAALPQRLQDCRSGRGRGTAAASTASAAITVENGASVEHRVAPCSTALEIHADEARSVQGSARGSGKPVTADLQC